MSDIRSSLFGRLALETKLITLDQIQECLNLQIEYEKSGKKKPRLGELMAAKGYLTIDQVRDLLQKQKVENPPEVAPEPEKIAPEQYDDSGESMRRGVGEMFGNFKILKRLAVDSAGYTYKAKYIPKEMTVILRVLSQERMVEDPEYVKRFEQQVNRATELHHENIQRLIITGRKNQRDYYATEYIEGISLRRILETRGKLEPEFVREIASQALQAMEYAHTRGVFHQEIRPSNIMITTDHKIKLVAFGVARDVMGNLKMLAADAGDTPFYVAPEQAVRQGTTGAGDARTDIYCLGVTLYHAVTGQPPFKGSSIGEVLLNLTEDEVIDPLMLTPELPRAFADIILAMMNPEPADRYQTAVQTLQDLEKIQLESASGKEAKDKKTLPFKPRSSTAVIAHDSTEKSKKKKRGQLIHGKEDGNPAVLIAGLVVIAIGAGILLYIILNKEDEPRPRIQQIYKTPSSDKKKLENLPGKKPVAEKTTEKTTVQEPEKAETENKEEKPDKIEPDESKGNEEGRPKRGLFGM